MRVEKVEAVYQGWKNHFSHLILDPVLSHQRSWPDFVWLLSLPHLAILFNHMHPLLQSIFLHFIHYLLFPRLFRSSSTTESHFHLLYQRNDSTLLALAILSKDFSMTNMSINS